MPSHGTYRAIMLTRRGGPDALEPVELASRPPAAGEARLKVLACGAGGTDVLMRRGYYPFAPKIPFVPGYDVVGEVDAIGAGVTNVAVGDKVALLSVWGGHAEMIYRGADELVRVPPGLDDAQVVALILNYATAYQMIHRVAHQKRGETALATGANGGVGVALLELLRDQGVKAYGAASERSHDLVRSLGAIPVESRKVAVDEGVLASCPGGVDASYDNLGGKYVAQCARATRRGGHVVGCGFSATIVDGRASKLQTLRQFGDLWVGARIAGRKVTHYGITWRYRKNRKPFLEDLPKLFTLLAEKRVDPRIAARLPLLAARRANEMMEAGGVDGKIVLLRELGLD